MGSIGHPERKILRYGPTIIKSVSTEGDETVRIGVAPPLPNLPLFSYSHWTFLTVDHEAFIEELADGARRSDARISCPRKAIYDFRLESHGI